MTATLLTFRAEFPTTLEAGEEFAILKWYKPKIQVVSEELDESGEQIIEEKANPMIPMEFVSQDFKKLAVEYILWLKKSEIDTSLNNSKKQLEESHTQELNNVRDIISSSLVVEVRNDA